MYALIGIAAVFAAVLGGFLLEKGNPWVLLQPAELLIVGGAAAGIVMVANPPSVMRKMWHGCLAAFRPPPRTPQDFLNAGPATGYSNWELSSDRANAARRWLHAYGVRPEQVVEVRGYADQRPFNDQDRFDARNRRVSVVVRFTA